MLFLIVTPYVEEVFSKVNKLQERVLTAQNNIQQVFAQISKWANVAIFDRYSQLKTGKFALLALDENAARKQKRYSYLLCENYNYIIL